MRNPFSDEHVAAFYVAIVAAAHVVATWMSGTQAEPGGQPLLVGGASIVAWLIFWWFYRTDLRHRWGFAGPEWVGHVHYPRAHHDE